MACGAAPSTASLAATRLLIPPRALPKAAQEVLAPRAALADLLQALQAPLQKMVAPALAAQRLMVVVAELAVPTETAPTEAPVDHKPVAAEEEMAAALQAAPAPVPMQVTSAVPEEKILQTPAEATAAPGAVLDKQEPTVAAAEVVASSAPAAKAETAMIFQLHQLPVAVAAEEEEAVVPAAETAEIMAVVAAVPKVVRMEALESKELSSLFILLEKHLPQEICSTPERRDRSTRLEN